MKKAHLFLFLALLLGLSSCTMQKRLYRKGWYLESRSPGDAPAAMNAIDAQAIREEEKNNSPAAAASLQEEKLAPAVQATIEDTSKKVRKRRQPRRPGEQKYSYYKTRKEMAARGCRVHPYAKTLHTLSALSWPLTFFIIGPLVALLVIKLTPNARKAIERDNESCKDDNLRIVDETEQRTRRSMLFFAIVATFILAVTVAFYSSL